MRLVKPAWVPTPLIRRDDRPPVSIAPPSRDVPFGTAIVLGRLLWWALTMLSSSLLRRGNPSAYGRGFRLLLEDLGGLWIKLGQLLSLRVDLFPLEFCRELSQLQSKATGFSPDLAVQIIEEDLGAPVSQLFADFEAVPTAAASIGQVHRATLRDSGVRVAVKVQRPGLPRTFEQQFRVIRGIVWLLQKSRYRSHMRWEDLVWELRHIMLEEMDCRFEASSTRRMRKNLKAHGIYAPKVFYATERVMVSEFIDGVLMADYIRMMTADPGRLNEWRLQNGITAREVGRQLLLSLLRQLMEDNLFHGDLHPGNILLLRDNRVALIDFGSCSFSEKTTLDRFRMSIRALGQRNYAQAAELYVLLAGTLPADVDSQSIRDAFLEELCDWGARTEVKELPYHDKSIAAIYNAVLKILYEHHCTMEWALLRIRRGLETLDASLIHLYPDCNYSEVAQTYGRQAMIRQAEEDAGREVGMAVGVARGAFEVAPRLAEYGIFQAAILRRHLRSFSETGTQAMDLLATATGLGAALGLLGSSAGAAIWLAQRHPARVAFLGDAAVARLASLMPVLDWQIWAVLLATTFYASNSLIRLRRRLGRHEPRASERVAAV